MTRVIPLLPNLQSSEPGNGQITTEQLIEAAWQLAYCALWHDQPFAAKEVQAARNYIGHYFHLSLDTQKAFTALCERVLLANRYLNSEQSRFVPQPSIWFNPKYQYGFAGTLPWYHRLIVKRTEVEGYQAGIAAVAKSYWQYATGSPANAFTSCRKNLLQLREYGLLQIFSNAVLLLSFQYL